MTNDQTSCQTPVSNRWNRIGYWAFIVFGLAMTLLHGPGEGFMYFGIALVFDPFNQEVKWSQRPLYQRAWLLIHLLVSFALLGFAIGKGW